MQAGSKVDVASSTMTRDEALWAASVIEKAMGRSDRIGVEFGPMLATTHGSAPPQTRGPSTNTIRDRRATSASLVMMAMFVAFFGWMIWNFQKGISKSRARSGAVTASAIPAGALSVADIAMFERTNPQALVENLLERSIRHDDSARELLMSELPKLTSRIKMTDSMTKLEYRSQYSRDLRVRQANVAVNLAIAQYAAQDGAAADLLEYGRQHPEMKASTVYYAGMLGSTESNKDAVVEMIKQFALHDPDAKVRQWAVEGLRFFNTEQALAVEWESFTTDPSNDVRDRAGCNVSDCGIFTRKMRFIYVPKLIELLDDPKQSAQMHSWAAMALTEITDANMANNRRAWEQWYAANAKSKAAEFDSIPWYQVRGDE
jgi:hypothetical protein